MIFVRGAHSSIAQALAELVSIRPIGRNDHMPENGERYLFCSGVIRQAKLKDQTDTEIADTFEVNAVSVMRECDRLTELNPRARICVVGSEAAFTWSYDGAYASSKAALHCYVETKRLTSPDQQLVCVSPTVVLNTGMTDRRNAAGVAALEERRGRHPKQRWLQPIEVARMIHFLLCVDEGYTTGVVLRMNGGEHCGSR